MTTPSAFPGNLVASSQLRPTATKTSNYTAVANDLVICDASGGALTVTLPPATSAGSIAVKKQDASVNAVTVAAAGSDTIHGGQTTTSLAGQGDTCQMISDGVSAWYATVWLYATDSGSGTTYAADGVTLQLIGTTFSINPGGVGTTQLGTGAVTYANLQKEGAHTLLGNPTGSAAAPAEVSLGTGLSFSGTTLNSGSLTQMSVAQDVSGIRLVNDAPSPGALFFYGTDVNGNKGWFPQQISTTEGQWNYFTTNVMADPGSGKYRTDATGWLGIANLAVSTITYTGIDRTAYLAALQVGDTLAINTMAASSNWVHYRVTALPTNNGTWFLIPVADIESSGAPPANSTVCLLTFSTTGTGGTSGVTSFNTRTGAVTLQATDLPNTAVTPGSYTSANVTIDSTGRVTAAASGSYVKGFAQAQGSGSGTDYTTTSATFSDVDTTNLKIVTANAKAGDVLKIEAICSIAVDTSGHNGCITFAINGTKVGDTAGLVISNGVPATPAYAAYFYTMPSNTPVTVTLQFAMITATGTITMYNRSALVRPRMSVTNLGPMPAL